MNHKIFVPFFAIVTLVVMGVYFLVNPSYEKSLEAKYYYETANYKDAYALAKEAFGMNVYNRMASTIMAQSKTSLKYVDYIEMAQKYMKEINSIVMKDEISDSDKAKIKMMSHIMIDSYIKLAPSVITDKKLVEQSAEYYHGFEKLLEKVN